MVSFPPFFRASKPSSSRNKAPSLSSSPSITSIVPTSSAASTTSSSSSHSSSAGTVLPSASATLAEALRGNPFGTTTRLPSPEALRDAEREREREELNDALYILAELFPDVKTEVFRELLLHFDGNSRLQVCVEQLMRYRNEWVKGRWNVPTAGDTISPPTRRRRLGNDGEDYNWKGVVPGEELFRSDHYKKAVKTALCYEFRAVSRSAIDAVLAEVNYSYTRARPTLKHLSQKTWRVALGNILSFKKTKEKDDPPLLIWQRQPNGDLIPQLKSTACEELDRELHDFFVQPVLTQKKEKQETEDLKLARELNEADAKAADALYECSCCLADVPFEEISMCSISSHVTCHCCIQRTVQEAIFGQGWGKSINCEKSTLSCLAPLQSGTCEGVLDASLVKRAILSDKSGTETLQKFESRLAEESLLKSQLRLVRCPHCSYAEYDPVYHSKGPSWRFRRASLLPTICMIFVLLDVIPLLVVLFTAFLLLCPTSIPLIFTVSIQNLWLKTRNQRFTCSNPICRRASCVNCQKPWKDPHVCYEPLLLNLRTTVEAARTAAIKRTCPRCGLSFVKSSGCNKLTCVCGYSMCYLCRKALGPPLTRRRDNVRRINREDAGPVDGILEAPAEINTDSDEEPNDDEEGEGYKHFCEHFRVNPGSRCTECTKCDLYMAEDEEIVAQRAGEKAEREWRSRQGFNVPSSSNQYRDGATHSPGRGFGKFGPQPSSTLPPRDLNLRLDSKGWPSNYRFWTRDIWSDGRWKREAQLLVDKVVEALIIIDA